MVGKDPESYRPRRALADDGDDTSASTDPPPNRPGRAPARHGVPRSSARQTAVLAGAVAAVVILGLVIGYALFSRGDSAARPSTPAVSASAAGSSGEPANGAVLLTDASMLTAAHAEAVDGKRTWTVALTQKGLDADSRQPVCLGGEPAEGEPAAQQTVLRVLSSSGSAAPSLLHQADGYATVEEATQAYASTSKALGGCSAPATSIDSGQLVSGVGDQSVGLVLKVHDGATPEYRSVILSRTGRILNVVDAAARGRIVSQRGVMAALAAVTNLQCASSGGKCAKDTGLRDGPPPIGGDQAGFLATGDLPPVGTPAGTWVGDVPTAPNPDLAYSGCETTRFDKVKGTAKARTYLLDGAAGVFGLDEVVLTLSTPKAAAALAAEIRSDIVSCPRRKLTADVTTPTKVERAGANQTTVVGWTATVTQSTSATAKNTYRVGVTTVGPKVVYVFLSADPGKKLDIPRPAWDLVTVRAGQRASQVR